MSQTILQIVQEFCGKKTLPIPNAVMGSSDTGVVQIRYLLQEVVRDLADYPFPDVRNTETFTTVAQNLQGVISDLFSLGGSVVEYILPNTMWNVTLEEPIYGPLTEAQYAEALVNETSPRTSYIVMSGGLYFTPIPTTGQTIRAVVQFTRMAVESGTGTILSSFTADTNTLPYPDSLIHKALDWRWKEQKGEPWEVAYKEFMALLPKKIGKFTLPVLSMDSHHREGPTPGIWIPAGNWPTA